MLELAANHILAREKKLIASLDSKSPNVSCLTSKVKVQLLYLLTYHMRFPPKGQLSKTGEYVLIREARGMKILCCKMASSSSISKQAEEEESGVSPFTATQLGGCERSCQ